MADGNENKKIRNRTEALEQLAVLIDITAHASGQSGKGTLADYVRLVQLEHELREEENDGVGGILVQWKDNNETDSTE